MVKKGFVRVLFAAAALSLGSCATNSDIDDLKGELDDLRGELSQLEKMQQEALAAQILALQTEIAALQAELMANGEMDDALAAEYDALLDSLTSLQDEVSSGAKVHYGSVITAADFASFAESGATIATGDVIITSDDQLASLEKLALVGGDLIVKGGSAISLTNLESVSGDVIIQEMSTTDASVSLPGLKSVGYSVKVMGNTALDAVKMEELLLVNRDINVGNNDALATFEMAKLDLVGGDVSVSSMINYDAGGSLVVLDLNSTNVVGDVMIEHVGSMTEGNMEKLSFGHIGGNFTAYATLITELEYTSNELPGDFVLEGNAGFETFTVNNLETVGGDFRIQWNTTGVGAGSSNNTGFSKLEGFDALTKVGGTMTISNNNFTHIDAFNSVMYVNGGRINLKSNGNEILYVSVFESFVGVEESMPGSYMALDIYLRTDSFDGFSSVTTLNSLDLQIEKHFVYNSGGGGIGIGIMEAGSTTSGEMAIVKGFENLESVERGTWNFDDITEMHEEAFMKFKTVNRFANLTIHLPSDMNVQMCSFELFADEVLSRGLTDTWPTEPNLFWQGTQFPMAEIGPAFFVCGGFGIGF